MESDDDKFAAYVCHPRYGRSPRYTGLNPDYLAPDVQLHWNSTNHREITQRYEALTGQKWEIPDPIPFLKEIGFDIFKEMGPELEALMAQQWPIVSQQLINSEVKRIPGTAVVADLARQTAATVPVTHYFDLDRICRDCRQPFIFFAEEQKYWYEQLRFGLDSDCVRCVPCRKVHQVVARRRKRYEELFHVPVRSINEDIEMADCCLSLIESSVFTLKKLQLVRALINRIRCDNSDATKASRKDLLARVIAIEATAKDT